MIDAVPSLTGNPGRRRRERRVSRILAVAAITSIVISVLIVVSLIGQAVSFITSIDLSSLWDLGWFPQRNKFDLRTIIVASVIISGVAILVAGPLGLGAAVYLSEYAPSRVRRILKPILEVLASIPSVVVGFFALTFINPVIVQSFFTDAGTHTMLAAGIGVGVLVTPLMASIAEDALRAVPDSLREASAGLGARKRTTVLRVVLPAALSGVVAAAIISVSRAIGETMVVTIAGGATGSALFEANPLEPGLTMTAAIANLALGSDNPAIGDPFASLYFVGIVLFIFTLGLNILGDRIVRRYRRVYA
ncbi:MAG: phosphate ABC transporter permease subunit PstC [Actinobacteria bacterium]|nr:phosphate ABC transporter permease subunit PstC [Actinomycetota bacterium]